MFQVQVLQTRPSCVGTGWQKQRRALNMLSGMSSYASQPICQYSTQIAHLASLRDGALRALHTLKSSFADLDRYEHLLVLRAADARDAFAHSLSLLSHQVQVQAHTHSQPTHEQELPQLPPLPPPLRGAERLRDGYGNGGADAGPGGPSRPHPADRMTHPHAPAPAAAPLQPSSHAHAHGIGHGNGAHPPPTLTPASFSHGKPALASSLSTAGAEVFTSLALNLPPPPSASASTPTSKRRRHDWSSAPAAENGVDADGLKSAAATTAPRIDARQLVRESKERNRLDYARSRASNGHLLRHAEVRGVKRPRSTSHSSHGSLSLDEMLLETATPSTLDPPPHPNPLLNSSLPPPVARNAVSASGLGPTGTLRNYRLLLDIEGKVECLLRYCAHVCLATIGCSCETSILYNATWGARKRRINYYRKYAFLLYLRSPLGLISCLILLVSRHPPITFILYY